MTRTDLDALVIGAGVSGLTTAVCLAEAGLRVKIWAAEPPEQSTSYAAGAMWGPYLVEPIDRVRVWSAQTLDVLLKLATDPQTGVRLVPGVEASRKPVDPPEWGNQLDGFRMCDVDELPDGFATGWRYTAPLADMPTYLGYLERRFSAASGQIEIRLIDSLDQAAGIATVVVNCAGMGARGLVPDPELTPIRGQLVVVENPGITEFFSEDTGLSPDLVHFYPQGETVVLGGTAQPGDWSREPDPNIAAAIIARCASVEPRLRNARVIEHRVGLRPTRPYVRVEGERLDGGTLIHNYGHGGAGFTLSWGCAKHLLGLVC
ncbi:FAD-dependent oxidoreductase [Micromonospora sp. 4G57]|uniref:D-amino-acid oxidase n=1 Tax=Micromonospora sicca TaxID=2202420 RepID=A0ABU5JP17_9ACTN|nr:MULTISPECIES: FAD-dependent oxidoreductase [unclassified Micromonospora]MDZ5447563.1 FAD-dependent oxidoreductase [Micromonospora sp. 4G57]MDZ5494281.1 FAD-dependent oxidoreductase [Micromonospora sp. 4G53]